MVDAMAAKRKTGRAKDQRVQINLRVDEERLEKWKELVEFLSRRFGAKVSQNICIAKYIDLLHALMEDGELDPDELLLPNNENE